MEEELKKTEKSIRDILHLVFKHKWKIILIFLAAMIVTAYVINSAPVIYESEAKLAVKMSGPRTVEMVTGISGLSQVEVIAEIELFRSRGFAETVVDSIGLDLILYVPEDKKSTAEKLVDYFKIKNLMKILKRSTPMKEELVEPNLVNPIQLREAAIQKVMSALKISPVRGSSIANVTYQASTPKHAQEILSKIIAIYMVKRFEINTSAISIEFLSVEEQRLKKELAKSEEEFRQYMTEGDIISLPEEQTFLLGRIANLQTEISQTEADIYASLAAVESMRKSLDLRAQLRGEEIRITSLNARLEILNKQIEEAKTELDLLSSKEQNFTQLQRNVERQEQIYNRYLSALEQTRIAKTLENEKISNISVMQEPTYLINPIKKEKKKTLAMGLFLGLAGGIGLAFVLEFLNHTVKSIEDVENKLLLHNITAIPPVKTNLVSRVIKKEVKRKKHHLPISSTKMSKNVTSWLYFLTEVRDCFEDIKARIFDSMKSSGKSTYILGVTSCYREEGVSTIATGLAYSLALFEKENVLLVDSNLHHPNTDEVPGINRPPGLFEMSVKRQRPQSDIENENIYSFSNDNMDDYMSSVDSSKKINKLLPSVERFDYKIIVLDLPTMSEGISVLKSASLVDGIIFVIEAEKVRREVIINAKEKLEKSGVNIFGVVLNKRRFYIPQWLYRKL